MSQSGLAIHPEAVSSLPVLTTIGLSGFCLVERDHKTLFRKVARALVILIAEKDRKGPRSGFSKVLARKGMIQASFSGGRRRVSYASYGKFRDLKKRAAALCRVMEIS